MKKEPEKDNGLDSKYLDEMMPIDVVSTTECTGMILTPPLTEDEVDGYTDIFHVQQQKATSAQKADNPAEQESRS
jgi:hypothetical protein